MDLSNLIILEQDEASEEKESDNEVDWEDILLDDYETGGRREEYEEREHYEPTAIATRDLYDHLRDQLSLTRVEPRQIMIGEEIIGNIDDAGFLTCSVEQITYSLNQFLQSEYAAAAGFADPVNDLEALRHALDHGDQVAERCVAKPSNDDILGTDVVQECQHLLVACCEWIHGPFAS